MKPTILRYAATLIALATVTACTDGSPSTAPEAASSELAITASSFDSEATRASDGGDTERATAFREAAAALRLGVRPTTIGIGVNGETHRFQAVVTANLEVLADQDTALRRTLIAWRGDRTPVEILRVVTLGNQGSFSSADEPATNARGRAHGLLVSLQRASRWVATAGTTGIVLGEHGGACEPITRVDANFRCVRAGFAFDVDGLFRLGGSSPDDELAAVRVQAPAQRVPGVILSPARNQ
ncbi:MAG: hypothetical protein IT353_23555 [Gemmatimonadaceae bacterium]|nr:hypothetical protein [Gemmatimonadaceae bacterium]